MPLAYLSTRLSYTIFVVVALMYFLPDPHMRRAGPADAADPS